MPKINFSSYSITYIFNLNNFVFICSVDQGTDLLDFFNNEPIMGNQTRNDAGQSQKRTQTQNGMIYLLTQLYFWYLYLICTLAFGNVLIKNI